MRLPPRVASGFPPGLTASYMKDVNHTVRANGIRQHYLDAGEGPTVVLLHGFPETSFAWRFQIPVLAKRFRVIAPDLRGYGETDKPAGGYDKRNMALDTLSLLDKLDIGKVALVGRPRRSRGDTLRQRPPRSTR